MLGCGLITQVSSLFPPVMMLFPLQLTETHTHIIQNTCRDIECGKEKMT